MSAQADISQASFPNARHVPGAIWNTARFAGLPLKLDFVDPGLGTAYFALASAPIDPLIAARLKEYRLIARTTLVGPSNAVVSYERRMVVSLGGPHAFARSYTSKFKGDGRLLVEFECTLGVPDDPPNASHIVVGWSPTSPAGVVMLAGPTLEVMAFRTSGGPFNRSLVVG